MDALKTKHDCQVALEKAIWMIRQNREWYSTTLIQQAIIDTQWYYTAIMRWLD
jgi:hypothetical protein